VAACVYCRQRKGKRACPALQGAICAVCCGTHRGSAIACPSDCVYFLPGEAYQKERAGRHFLQARQPLHERLDRAHGDRALALLTERPTDAVVLDAMMPGRDGFETCRALRALPGHEHVPVLMLTGLDDNASITRAFEAGATDFFVKSHQWSLLAGRLHYLLRASQTRMELERSKAKLARAQDLARMGSFDWRRAGSS